MKYLNLQIKRIDQSEKSAMLYKHFIRSAEN